MELLWWLITIVLFAVGLIGTVVPVLPGTTIILAAAVVHRLALGADKGVSWLTLAVLIALTGWGREEDIRRSQEAGFDAHLVKRASQRQRIDDGGQHSHVIGRGSIHPAM